MDKLRLNKFLAACGITSRRKADELIKQGKVLVNGEVVSDLSYKV
ncbi:MAG TPA: rRNA pseudouridine synthase, partial [Thermodesulfobacterium commune]|nr:rRNA pseudouridine synthase [Thermodesulfobacterium commune]